jgi:thioredoxin-like negative regulator of GroEL
MTRTHTKNKPRADKKNLLIIGGIIGIVFLLIFLKGQVKAQEPMAPDNEAPDINSVAPVAQTMQELPEQMLDRLYNEKEPVFAFFHSNNCHLCIEMIKVVDEVIPEYDGKVSLVDINVYDENNKSLLQRAQIQAIPTQIFISSTGEVSRQVGLMSADQLRTILDQISEEE